MPDDTKLDTSDLAAPGPGYVALEEINFWDTVEELTAKFRTVIRQVGDAVIKDALEQGDLAALSDTDELKRRMDIQYRWPPNSSEAFRGKLEVALAGALASELEFLRFKALGARLGAAAGGSSEVALARGNAFAVFSEFIATSMRGGLTAADPVTLFNGEFTHVVTDARISGAGIDFEFARTYASRRSYDGPLGASWDHSGNLWLRVTSDEGTIACANGALREDVYVRHEVYDYWMPPDGEDAVITRAGDSFVRRTAYGMRYTYANDGDFPFLHRIARIEDRFGNYLAFTYEDGSLRRIEVNHPARSVTFETDSLGRITATRDHTGRTWSYGYDGWGDLVAVTSPATAEHPEGLTTLYEYSSDQSVGDAQHKLFRIVDPSGATYLANEYGIDPGTLAFNRVVAQRQGGGEVLFGYGDIIQELDFDYSPLERPAHETVVTQRNGHLVRHVFNQFGNLLLREEQVAIDGIPTLLQTRCRYNADGNLTAMLTPEGVMTQYVHGREAFIRANGIEDEKQLVHDARLTVEQRQAFNRRLAVVRRARQFQSTDLDLSRGAWGDMFPDAFTAIEPDGTGGIRDIVTKFTYEPTYGQPLSTSDPRWTDSADPTRQSAATGEHPRYEETLTRYVYDGPPGDGTRYLVAVVQPPVISADGTLTPSPTESFRGADGQPAYDERGRLLRRTDTAGTVTMYAYFDEVASDARSGHLREVLVDPGGLAIATSFEVDALGRVVATRLPRGAGSADDTFVTRVDYDELDHAIESRAPAPFGYRTHRSFGPNGMLRHVERELVGADGQPVAGGVELRTFRYDEELHLVRETLGGADVSRHLVVRHCYDGAGLLALTIEPAGTQIRYGYDPRQLPVWQTHGAGGPEGSTRRIGYDGDGRVSRGVSARGNVTRYTLDVFGRLVATENPLGHVTWTTYDKAGNVTCIRQFELRPEGWFLLARSETDYDELHRVVRHGTNLFDAPVGPFTKDELAQAARASPGPGHLLVTTTFYDPGGRVARTVDPLGRETACRYDTAGRRAVVVNPVGDESRYEYDAHSNVVRVDHVEVVRDPVTLATTGTRVFTTTNDYDELDRAITHTDPLGNVTRYEYDSRGLGTARVDSLGNRVRVEHDVFGRRVGVHEDLTASGLGGAPVERTATTTIEYDANGNAVALVDALGRRTEQRFDRLNRRRAVRYVDGTETTFDYDADDNFALTDERNGVAGG
jgi:YD repeat-containing protein